MPDRWEPASPAIDGESFEATLAREPIVLIHFWAEWNACDRDQDRALQHVRAEFAGRISVRSADVDRTEVEPVWRACGVSNVPTLAGFVRGRKVWTIGGLRTEAELRALLAGLVSEASRATTERPSLLRRLLRRLNRTGPGTPPDSALENHRL